MLRSSPTLVAPAYAMHSDTILPLVKITLNAQLLVIRCRGDNAPLLMEELFECLRRVLGTRYGECITPQDTLQNPSQKYYLFRQTLTDENRALIYMALNEFFKTEIAQTIPEKSPMLGFIHSQLIANERNGLDR